MTIAIRQVTDPRALVEASQAIRVALGRDPLAEHYRPRVLYPRVKRKPAAERPAVITPGCMIGRKWTEADVRLLEKMAGSYQAQTIADALGRTKLATLQKAQELLISVKLRRGKRQLSASAVKRSREIFSECYPSMRAIIASVSQSRGVSVDAILSQSRKQPVMLARREALWMMGRDTKLSMAQMANRLRLDHTTVRHAIIMEDKARGTNVHETRAIRAKVSA